MCVKPNRLRITDEVDESNQAYIRCCGCSGKWGYIDLSNNEIYPFFSKFRKKPSRYISREDRYVVLKRQKWRCNSCGKPLKYNGNSNWEGELAHIDHIHPFSQWKSYDGDINELSNLQALCPLCNKEKYNKTKPLNTV